MGIKLELGIVKGWKATQNNRFGEVLEVRFVDNTNGEVKFRYAPKLDEEEDWNKFFNLLREYDESLKRLKEIVSVIEEEPKISIEALQRKK